jgi:predicted metal-dependent HD superfamily phosphohydrolase
MTPSDQSGDVAGNGPGTTTAAARLGPRFERSWADLNGHDAVTIYRVLTRFYGQQHRHYHTLTHVEDCLREFDAFQAAHPTFLSGEMWHAVELALWFHDVIHEPRAGDNEERSADIFEAIAAEAMFPTHVTSCVRRLILATKIDTPSPTAEEQVTIDCDLASLGYAPEIFKRSGAAIRNEYGFLPDGDFTETRRAAFLPLSQRPRIYRTEFMRLRYERQARLNLAAALEASNPFSEG